MLKLKLKMEATINGNKCKGDLSIVGKATKTEIVSVGGALAQVINEIIPVLDENEVLGLFKEINKPFEEFAERR